MRLNFKWIVAIGLLLGIANVWWEQSSAKKKLWDTEEQYDTAPAKVRARETKPAPVAAPTVATVLAATWQSGIQQVLTSSASTPDQAKTLLAQFPNLPPAGQFEAAHHISNLLPDDSYGSWAGYLTNSAVPPETRNVIYADLLRRPNAIKLPLLLQLARSPSSPQATEALQLLSNTLGEDHGSNWSAWSLRIQAWLKANPDPARPGFSGMTVGN